MPALRSIKAVTCGNSYRHRRVSDIPRLVAWRRQLLEAHAHLRLALRTAQDAARNSADIADASRDLLLYCHGFCVALDGHHRGEDALLFPALVEQYPAAARVVWTRGEHARDLLRRPRVRTDAGAGDCELLRQHRLRVGPPGGRRARHPGRRNRHPRAGHAAPARGAL